MISVLGTTSKYILQPSLLEMHRYTLECLSVAEYWKLELAFYQKLLERHNATNSMVEFKKQVDHFQNLIIYYRGELIDLLRKKLREHETKLARMLQQENESDTEYYKEHNGLMEELTSFQRVYLEFKHTFYEFIEKGI